MQYSSLNFRLKNESWKINLFLMKYAFSAQYGCIDQYSITWEHFKLPSLRKPYPPKMNAIQKEDKSSDIEQ